MSDGRNRRRSVLRIVPTDFCPHSECRSAGGTKCQVLTTSSVHGPVTLCLNAHGCDRPPAVIGHADPPSSLAWKITGRIPHHLASEVDGFDPCGVVIAKVSFGW